MIKSYASQKDIKLPVRATCHDHSGRLVGETRRRYRQFYIFLRRVSLLWHYFLTISDGIFMQKAASSEVFKNVSKSVEITLRNNLRPRKIEQIEH